MYIDFIYYNVFFLWRLVIYHIALKIILKSTKMDYFELWIIRTTLKKNDGKGTNILRSSKKIVQAPRFSGFTLFPYFKKCRNLKFSTLRLEPSRFLPRAFYIFCRKTQEVHKMFPENGVSRVELHQGIYFFFRFSASGVNWYISHLKIKEIRHLISGARI